VITRALEKIEDTVVNVCRTWQIPEDIVRADFDKTKPHLIHALLIVTNVVTNNNHPELLVLLFSPVIVQIIPEGFILWPILRFLGFSRLGPVKDSIAARSHSFFFGTNVPRGSLFAWFQSVGMKMGGLVRIQRSFLAILKFLFPFF